MRPGLRDPAGGRGCGTSDVIDPGGEYGAGEEVSDRGCGWPSKVIWPPCELGNPIRPGTGEDGADTTPDPSRESGVSGMVDTRAGCPRRCEPEGSGELVVNGEYGRRDERARKRDDGEGADSVDARLPL